MFLKRYSIKMIVTSLVALSIVIIVGIMMLLPTYVAKNQARSFLTELYTATYNEAQVRFGSVSQEEAQLILNNSNSELQGRFGKYLTVECFDRLLRNRTLESLYFLADRTNCDFKPQNIRSLLINREKEQYKSIFTLDLMQYDNLSGELLNQWEIKINIDFVQGADGLKIQSVYIVNQDYLSQI